MPPAMLILEDQNQDIPSERCSLDEFLDANAEAPETCEKVRDLRVKESVLVGGGAQPLVKVTRES